MVNAVLKHSISVNRMTLIKNIPVIEYFMKFFYPLAKHICKVSFLLALFLFIFSTEVFCNNDNIQNVTPAERGRSLSVLQQIVSSDDPFLKIKAAEYLISLGYKEGLKGQFEKEEGNLREITEYKLAVWMILAKLSFNSERDFWVDKVRDVLNDPGSGYSGYAAKMLLKLDYPFTAEELKVIEGQPELDQPDNLPDDEAKESVLLSDSGTGKDIPYLIKLLDHDNDSVRAEAANAILRIERRVTHHMGWQTWLFIAIYGIGLIGIGFFYKRRNKTSDDYHLGGRTMNSVLVGISLYATLLSALSYLMSPGEIIKHGPMCLGSILAFPLIYYIVGWLMIPYIMRLKVTSAYELLEKRFNNSVRTLSSAMFLALRLLWMAVIIYAITDKVFIPLSGIDPGWAPLVSVVLGIVTLLYTSMGGIRAVVVTDVLQFLILFGGAFIVLVLITIKLGGVSEWWPSGWMEHWAPPRLGFQTTGSRTLGWFILAQFIWHICTNGSDQMAIQRFLSTRDVKAARKVMRISLVSNIIVRLFLAMVGLALLAFFKNNPHLLSDGQSIYANADELFPQYIVTSLPVWASSLVILGILAAAMSSLSSGVNSSSAVIIEDFIKRFRKKTVHEVIGLRTIRMVTVAVGVVVVAISLYVYVVPGNLYEVTYRVANLLTAPLFIMFFMAMFIPWATVLGTWIGTVSSTAFAVIVSFWENIFGTQGPSFLYVMPGSFAVGIVVAMLISLVPIGPKGNIELTEIKK